MLAGATFNRVLGKEDLTKLETAFVVPMLPSQRPPMLPSFRCHPSAPSVIVADDPYDDGETLHSFRSSLRARLASMPDGLVSWFDAKHGSIKGSVQLASAPPKPEGVQDSPTPTPDFGKPPGPRHGPAKGTVTLTKDQLESLASLVELTLDATDLPFSAWTEANPNAVRGIEAAYVELEQALNQMALADIVARTMHSERPENLVCTLQLVDHPAAFLVNPEACAVCGSDPSLMARVFRPADGGEPMVWCGTCDAEAWTTEAANRHPGGGPFVPLRSGTPSNFDLGA